jgi:hypothetical protein
MTEIKCDWDRCVYNDQGNCFNKSITLNSVVVPDGEWMGEEHLICKNFERTIKGA